MALLVQLLPQRLGYRTYVSQAKPQLLGSFFESILLVQCTR